MRETKTQVQKCQAVLRKMCNKAWSLFHVEKKIVLILMYSNFFFSLFNVCFILEFILRGKKTVA